MRKLAPTLILGASITLALLMQGSAGAKEDAGGTAKPKAQLPVPFGVTVACEIISDAQGVPSGRAYMFFVDHHVNDALHMIECQNDPNGCKVVTVGLTEIRQGKPLDFMRVGAVQLPVAKLTSTYLKVGSGDVAFEYDLLKGQVTSRRGSKTASYPCSGASRTWMLSRMGVPAE